MHKIIEFCVTSSLALDNWYIVKLLAISQTIHTVCCEDDYFQKGNFKLFNSMFQSVYLVFSKKFFFSFGNLFAVRYLWVVWNEGKCWYSARQTFASLGLFTFARIACLLQLWIKTSELNYSIRGIPNNYIIMSLVYV